VFSSLKKAVALLTFVFMSASAFGHSHGHLMIDDGWVKASLPGSKMSSGFVTITNHGKHDDQLIAVYSDIAKQTELHSMEMHDGVMHMRAVKQGWPIAAGNTLELMPGGNHIMFMGLTTKLEAGDKLKITLEFAQAGKIDKIFMVKKVDAGHHMHDDHQDHGHHQNKDKKKQHKHEHKHEHKH
jgi:copper(I)-binding protein